MSITLKIKKGLDIPLAGAVAADAPTVKAMPSVAALVPDDFPGFIPKMEVKEGDVVLAGQPLAHDKRHEMLKLVSPLAGKVSAIVRGERRKILRIEVAASGEVENGNFILAHDKALASADAAKQLLLVSGLWAMMRQRPYDVVANPDAEPRDIFVTGFDSAPLAVDCPDLTNTAAKELEAGVKLLGLLTKGSVYLTRRAGYGTPDVPGATMVDIDGPHPAGLASTAISAIAPINKGETVWTLDIDTLWRIGAAALTGVVPTTARVALVGSEVKQPCIVETVIGAPIAEIIKGDVSTDGRHRRIISGNVLTGTRVAPDDFLRFPYRQVTVIPEGDDADEFMGWASLSPKKMSTSRSFPGHFFFKRLFRPDARVLGGRRAMILSGQFDRYMPLDILPEYLLKAIIARDLDRMEALGIYEVAPEDFALAEYADISKMELQRIVREGLDYLRKENE